MPRDAAIEHDFADGTYRFRLGYGELSELQDKADAGPGWVLGRLMVPTAENRGWRVQDISDVIRLGLIGGGMKPVEALNLVRTYVNARPPMENLMLAQAILSAALVGAPDETQKKSRPKQKASATASAESGASGPSSEPALQ